MCSSLSLCRLNSEILGPSSLDIDPSSLAPNKSRLTPLSKYGSCGYNTDLRQGSLQDTAF